MVCQDVCQDVSQDVRFEVAYKYFANCDCGLSDEVFRCTWCYDVGADVACSGVVRCGMVTKLCVSVDVLAGIFVCVLGGEVLGDVLLEIWKLKSRFMGTLAYG
ncbi:hypothetical protein F2Q70_00022471 [Brassica cretica]|nr:hypothetical protein F2Q70_00022471 [Brassica cretica]